MEDDLTQDGEFNQDDEVTPTAVIRTTFNKIPNKKIANTIVGFLIRTLSTKGPSTENELLQELKKIYGSLRKPDGHEYEAGDQKSLSGCLRATGIFTKEGNNWRVLPEKAEEYVNKMTNKISRKQKSCCDGEIHQQQARFNVGGKFYDVDLNTTGSPNQVARNINKRNSKREKQERMIEVLTGFQNSLLENASWRPVLSQSPFKNLKGDETLEEVKNKLGEEKLRMMLQFHNFFRDRLDVAESPSTDLSDFGLFQGTFANKLTSEMRELGDRAEGIEEKLLNHQRNGGIRLGHGGNHHDRSSYETDLPIFGLSHDGPHDDDKPEHPLQRSATMSSAGLFHSQRQFFRQRDLMSTYPSQDMISSLSQHSMGSRLVSTQDMKIHKPHPWFSSRQEELTRGFESEMAELDIPSDRGRKRKEMEPRTHQDLSQSFDESQKSEVYPHNRKRLKPSTDEPFGTNSVSLVSNRHPDDADRPSHLSRMTNVEDEKLSVSKQKINS